MGLEVDEPAADPLTGKVIGCAIEVHRILGPGLLESSYEQCLAHELALAEIPFRLQWPVPIAYKSVKLNCGFRADFLIADKLIVELKSVESVLPVHQAQLLTYLRLANCRTGLLINFNVSRLTNGIKRMVI